MNPKYHPLPTVFELMSETYTTLIRFPREANGPLILAAWLSMSASFIKVDIEMSEREYLAYGLFFVLLAWRFICIPLYRRIMGNANYVSCVNYDTRHDGYLIFIILVGTSSILIRADSVISDLEYLSFELILAFLASQLICVRLNRRIIDDVKYDTEYSGVLEMRFWAASMQFVVVGIVAALAILALFTVLAPDFVRHFPLESALLLSIPLSYILIRFSLILPATASGRNCCNTPRQSFKLSSAAGYRFYLSIYFSTMPFILARIVLACTVNGLAKQVPFNNLISLAAMLVATASTAVCFKYFIQGECTGRR